MSLISSIFYFIIALTILIAVHEWGHFIVARLVNVKVLRFSIGFGKPLLRYQGKKGTEYVLGMVPLGGYVKMLDENEAEVEPSELEHAFNRKPLWARIAVVIAGPALNIIFAIFALWLMFIIGITSMMPIVGKVHTDSIAADAGLAKHEQILAIDGHAIHDWRDFQIEMMTKVGSSKQVSIDVKNLQTTKNRQLVLPLEHWQLDPKQPDILKALGIVPYVPLLKPIIGSVAENGPAAKAGLKAGDQIVRLNNQPIKYWHEVVVYVQKNALKPLQLELRRNNKLIHLTLRPEIKDVSGTKVGFIGIIVQKQYAAAHWLYKQQYSMTDALRMALIETNNLIVVSTQMIWKFISAQVSLRNIGGPIGVAQGASQSAQIGLAYYLSFLALISISLGILNILPIPMLDGGHLLFYIVEFIIGRPVNKLVQEKMMGIGLIFLLGLTALAIFNDLSRLMPN